MQRPRQSPVGSRVPFCEPHGSHRERELSVPEWRSRAPGRMSWPWSPPHWQSGPVGPIGGPRPLFSQCEREFYLNPHPKPPRPYMHSPESSPHRQRSYTRQNASFYSPHFRMHTTPSPRSRGSFDRGRGLSESDVSQLYKPSMLADPWADLTHAQSQGTELDSVKASPATTQTEWGMSCRAGHPQ